MGRLARSGWRLARQRLSSSSESQNQTSLSHSKLERGQRDLPAQRHPQQEIVFDTAWLDYLREANGGCGAITLLKPFPGSRVFFSEGTGASPKQQS